MTIKIILADDHPVLIAGMHHELSALRTLDIVGTAHNSTEVIDLLTRRPCDILVTDYVMPGGSVGDGMGMLAFLQRRYPTLKIIVFTTVDNLAMVTAMLDMGIRAVLSKADEIDHLIAAIHAVHAGASYLSPSLRAAGSGPTAATTPERQKLSRRESEVVRLYVGGASINEIARLVNRTKQTVSTQKNSAMRKLGIQRDADLFKFAYESGLIMGSGNTDTQPHDIADRGGESEAN